jgi:signal transduction histidine kinase
VDQIRVIHLDLDAGLFEAARGILSAVSEIEMQRASSVSEVAALVTAHVVDVVLVSAPSIDGESQALVELKRDLVKIPILVFTALSNRDHLSSVWHPFVWSVVSTDQANQLALSILNAHQRAKLQQHCTGLEDELDRAKGLLLKSQKSITIGRLLGSIAHEINNPLEAVTNLLFLAQSATDKADANVCIEMAEKEVQRVGEITRQMLSFHRDSRTKEEVSVTGAIETALALYNVRLRQANIEVVRQYRHEGCLLAYSGDLRQVFSNLIANSLDAMPQGGRLFLRVQQRTSPTPTLTIAIADTGIGMPREITRRVGDLFFTTKGESGTGLGMWVTAHLLEKYHASIRIRSCTQKGRSGSAFLITFTEPHALFIPRARAARSAQGISAVAPRALIRDNKEMPDGEMPDKRAVGT